MNKIKIVIIEDEIEICKFLNIIFENNNFEPKFSNNAADRIKLITHYQPEIVILDLGLPDIDGLEVIKNIRNRKK